MSPEKDILKEAANSPDSLKYLLAIAGSLLTGLYLFLTKRVIDFSKHYVEKDDYRADMKDIKENIRENQKILREGVGRIHDRIDVLSRKDK